MPINTRFIEKYIFRKKLGLREKKRDVYPYCKKYNKKKTASPGMHGFKNWEQKRDKKRQKTIGSKTMFGIIVTNCKKYNKVIVKSTIRLVYV
jgi:hypothetical protein